MLLDPDQREYERLLSDQRIRAWSHILTEWVETVLDRRQRSLRARLAMVWNEPGFDLQALRDHNAEVGRQARLQRRREGPSVAVLGTAVLDYPERGLSLYGKAVPGDLSDPVAVREYLLDNDRWRDQIGDEGAELFARMFSAGFTGGASAIQQARERTVDPTDQLLLRSRTVMDYSGRERGADAVISRLSADSILKDDGLREILNDRLRMAIGGSTQNRMDQVLDKVLDPNATEDDLDEVWERAKGSRTQRSLWARVAANPLAAGVLNEAALRAAIALGVTHKQWLSSRDDRVRMTHRAPIGDGQTVGIFDTFTIGGIPLRYPGDPRAFAYGQAGAAQIYGCRCTLLFYADDDDGIRSARAPMRPEDVAAQTLGQPGGAGGGSEFGSLPDEIGGPGSLLPAAPPTNFTDLRGTPGAALLIAADMVPGSAPVTIASVSQRLSRSAAAVRQFFSAAGRATALLASSGADAAASAVALTLGAATELGASTAQVVTMQQALVAE